MADRLTVVGTLGQEPEERRTSRGTVVQFRMASNDRRRDAQGNWVDGPTSWYRVNAWGELGRNALQSLHRGQRVVVHGDLSVSEWDGADGHKGRSVEIRAIAIGHDLALGTAQFTRAARQQPATPPQQSPDASPEQPQADRSGEWAPPMTEEPTPPEQPAAAGGDYLPDEAGWLASPI
jgi:single-strand DNA-binding protein